MTKEEVQKSTQKKVQAVTTLCKQLNLVPKAEQMITPEGFIQGVVYFMDTEDYPVDKEEPEADTPAPDKPLKDDKKSDDKK